METVLLLQEIEPALDPLRDNPHLVELAARPEAKYAPATSSGERLIDAARVGSL